MDLVALYYDMVPFNWAALIYCTHARGQTIYGLFERSLYGGHFGRITFLRTVDHVSVGPSGGRGRRGEKGEAMRVKKELCAKNRLID